MSTMKQSTPTARPALPMLAARRPRASCRGVSPDSPITMAIVRPHSESVPTAVTRMRPLPSDTWRRQQGSVPDQRCRSSAARYGWRAAGMPNLLVLIGRHATGKGQSEPFRRKQSCTRPLRPGTALVSPPQTCSREPQAEALGMGDVRRLAGSQCPRSPPQLHRSTFALASDQHRPSPAALRRFLPPTLPRLP